MTPAAALTILHAEVDRLAAPLAEGLNCRRGCSACCVDDLTVHAVEADAIRARHADLLAFGEAHPPGACAFLSTEGACRVYDARPYVCRTQGLPLRWLDAAEDGSVVELRDLCPLNEPARPPVEALPADACWTLGPAEEHLARIQQAADADGPPSPRVRLRDLFAGR